MWFYPNKKTGQVIDSSGFFYFLFRDPGMSDRCYVPGKAAFQVGSFVLVDVVVLSQLVHHADHPGQKRRSFRLFGHRSELLDHRTGRLFIISVLDTTFSFLSDSFQR